MSSALAGLHRNADALAELGQAEILDARPRRRSSAPRRRSRRSSTASPGCGAAGRRLPPCGGGRSQVGGSAGGGGGAARRRRRRGGGAAAARRRRAPAAAALEVERRRLLEPAVAAAGAAHLASGRPDRAVRHDVAGLAGRTGEDHRRRALRTRLRDSKHGAGRACKQMPDRSESRETLEAGARGRAMAGSRCSAGEAASERERFDRPVRECRAALRHRRRDAVRSHLLAEGGRLLFPHRPVGRRQDVAAQAALSRAAAEPRR